jgi:hypothetical protein
MIDIFLYRILLGYYYIYVDDIKYKIIYPTPQIKYESEILYNSIVEENKYDKRWLTPDEISLYLKQNNIWNNDKEENLKNMQKLLEDVKIDLYINFLNEKKKKTLKQNIKSIHKNMDELLTTKKTMNHLGIEDHATSIKNEFVIMNTIYFNDKLYFDDPYKDSYSSQELNIFVYEIVKNAMDVKMLRQIAKSETWRSYASTTNLKRDFLDVNDDYKYLIGLHNMYENVKQHPECPSEDIIDDDDALDGWLLYQNRKAQKEKKKNSIMDKVVGGAKNAGEVFLMTTDQNESKEIFDINDDKTKQNINTLRQIAADNKNVKWQDLPFVQQDLKAQVSNNNQKGNK